MSDQVLTVRNVRPEVAGGDEGRCGDAQVDLHGAGLPQQDYDLAGGGAPDITTRLPSTQLRSAPNLMRTACSRLR